MTPIVWPLGCFRFEPYNVAPRPGSVEMTLGMVTVRSQVYTENNELVSVEMILTAAQEQTLRTFFKTTTVMGTQSFLVPLLMAGTLENREATFYGAPPTFTPVAHNVVRTAFMLLAKATLPSSLTYELIASDVVNINAEFIGNASSIPPAPAGTIVTINALASDRIEITKPNISVDGDLDWNGWSPWDDNANNPPGDGLTWVNWFVVSDQDNELLLNFSNGRYSGPTAAQIAADAEMPIYLSGATSYQFWAFDSPITDNRQGLSLRVKTYRPVLTP